MGRIIEENKREKIVLFRITKEISDKLKEIEDRKRLTRSDLLRLLIQRELGNTEKNTVTYDGDMYRAFDDIKKMIEKLSSEINELAKSCNKARAGDIITSAVADAVAELSEKSFSTASEGKNALAIVSNNMSVAIYKNISAQEDILEARIFELISIDDESFLSDYARLYLKSDVIEFKRSAWREVYSKIKLATSISVFRAFLAAIESRKM